MKWAYGVGFVLTVLAANYVTTQHGLVPVGFGLVATAGTYFAGLAFVLRDSLQDTGGRVAVLLAIIVGGLLSFVVAASAIAFASMLAFVVSELADFAVYTPLRSAGYVRAAVASNVVGTVVDTLLFLSIAGFGLTRDVVLGQFVGKLTITAAVVLLVLGARALRRAVPA